MSNGGDEFHLRDDPQLALVNVNLQRTLLRGILYVLGIGLGVGIVAISVLSALKDDTQPLERLLVPILTGLVGALGGGGAVAGSRK